MTSLACLLGSGLKCIFHWNAHLIIFLSQGLVSLWICLYQVLLKKEKYHWQKFYILMLFHQADRLCKLKTKEALTLIFVDFQNLFPSTHMSDHLKQPIVYDFQDNFPAEKLTHHQRHKLLI